jgi:hypothetical protein
MGSFIFSQVRDQWRAVVNTVINFGIQKGGGIFWIICD